MKPIVITLNDMHFIFACRGTDSYGYTRYVGKYDLEVAFNEINGLGYFNEAIYTSYFRESGYAGVYLRIKTKLADIIGLTDYQKYKNGIMVTFDVTATDLRVCDNAIWVYTCQDSGEWFYTNYWNTENSGDRWESALFPPDVVPSTQHALQQIIMGE